LPIFVVSAAKLVKKRIPYKFLSVFLCDAKHDVSVAKSQGLNRQTSMFQPLYYNVSATMLQCFSYHAAMFQLPCCNVSATMLQRFDSKAATFQRLNSNILTLKSDKKT